MSSISANGSAPHSPGRPPITGWTVAKLARRAVVGALLLAGFVGVGAWGLYRGTEPAQSASTNLSGTSGWRSIAAPDDLKAMASHSHGRIVTVLNAAMTHDVLSGRQQASIATAGTLLATIALRGDAKAQRPDIFGAPDRPLDAIVAAGFAGVLIDLTEATGALETIADIAKLATRHARRLAPGFIVVLAGREEIIVHTDLLRQIDGLMKVNLLTDARSGNLATDEAALAASRMFLDRARRAGKSVLVLERVARTGDADQIAADLRRMGYLPLVEGPGALRQAQSADRVPSRQ